MKKNKTNLLLPIGLLISSASQVAIHLTHLPDIITGTLTGIGIGVMLLAFIKPIHRQAS